MKLKVFVLFAIFLGSIAFPATAQQNSQNKKTAKYVFLFIGDGMGLAHISLTQAYLANKSGEIGMGNLCMTDFPVVGLCNTSCSNKQTTCSAASGTALSTGSKTGFGIIGKTADKTKDLSSITYSIKNSGCRVGLITTVSINHATPAAFYAHSDKRSDYYSIGEQLCKTNFDFFAGGGFYFNKGRDGLGADLYDVAAQQGYTIIQDSVDTKHFSSKSKTILLNPVSLRESEMPLAIDRDEYGGYSLSNLVEASIQCLTNNQGFFIMVEGGLIDWAAHYKDAAAIVHEVLDFDKAIGVALDFYRKHPDETLIVVTADHETGGLSLGRSEFEYDTDFARIDEQKNSATFVAPMLDTLIKNKAPFTEVKNLLLQEFFADGFTLSEAEIFELNYAYEYACGMFSLDVESERMLYGGNQPVAAAAAQIINKRSGIGFTSYYHTCICVPVFAIGTGSELFGRYLDNTDIPIIILDCMNIKKIE
ncbi:MAG TPA: alkaline phosphatase [Bacteroidales bacterium]|nr:alkaline phosphatase [Bacteroidales bacterium]